MKRGIQLILFLTVLVAPVSVLRAQEPQGPPPDDPIQQLRLTPEQRQRIRLINEQTKDERQMVNRRLREANAALDQALDSDPLDDNLVEQRMAELNAAHAAQLRVRVSREMRIRRVLTREQLATLHSLRLQIRDVMDGRPNNQVVRPGAQPVRPNQGNGIAPLRPGPGNPRPNRP